MSDTINTVIWAEYYIGGSLQIMYWINLSKRGGKDRVFQGLAGLLWGIPEELNCQAKENSVLPDSFIRIYILFWIGFCIGPPKIHRRFGIGLPKSIDGYVFALLNCIDGSVLTLFRFPSIFSHQNSTDEEFCWPLLLRAKSNKTTF